MLGAIAGDIIGSVYEHNNIKSKDFDLFRDHLDRRPLDTTEGRPDGRCFFTDDTVLTAAVAKWMLSDREANLSDLLASWAYRFPHRGYGGLFSEWMNSWHRKPYNSFGNGSAMRVSPVAWFARSVGEVLDLAKQSAEVTHNHPEGIKGAQATALAIWMARDRTPAHPNPYPYKDGALPDIIREVIMDKFHYDLTQTVDEIRDGYEYNETCQATVPQAITCALEATSFEDAIRNAVSIGGDSDTIAAIAGSIAEPMFGVPASICIKTLLYLPEEIRDVLVEMWQVTALPEPLPREVEEVGEVE
jgi:ADP-ribosyl-[dinitrogen reductase] hydrolase